MMRIARYLLILAVLGLTGLTTFAFLGDLSPVASETRTPVTLNGG